MKKFIISFMCIMLFSCHPVYAEIKIQESVTFDSINEDHLQKLCLIISEFSYNTMLFRQTGIAERDVLSSSVTLNGEYENQMTFLLDSIVNDAYIFPIYIFDEDKLEVSNRFSEVIYNRCLRG